MVKYMQFIQRGNIMIQKEINEIRRHLTGERCNIGKLYAYFVNQQKEIIARIENSMALMPQNEKDKFLTIIRKTLSGGLGKNLTDIAFSTQQVASGEDHKLLMKLKETAFSDEDSREKIISKVIENTVIEGNYVIILASDTYDVPFKTSDENSRGLDSTDVFSYIICAICPVKESKSELGYLIEEKEFHTVITPQTIANPEAGFMFPAFDDRSTNIYNALFYLKNTANVQNALIDALFKTEPPMSVPEQKETFTNALTQTLENDCSFDVVQSVHEQIRERITQHKESKDPTPIDFTANDVGNMLKYSGVSEEKINAFQEKCDNDFGKGACLIPTNIIDSKKFEVVTPQVKITVDPEYTYVVETRIIDGRKYLLIPADDSVAVNGINIKIPKEE